MSGIEVVGLLASIAQLAHYVKNIREFILQICAQVQSGSRGLEQRLDQLDRVLDTVREIEKNSFFHTPSIGRHLKAIVAQVESLQTVLVRLKARKPQATLRKFWNAYTEIRAEKQICTIFTKLEEEKSTLQLSMTEVNATLSSRTNTDLAQHSFTIQDTRGHVQEVLSCSVGIARQLENLSERLSMATSEADTVHFSRTTSHNQVDVIENGTDASAINASGRVQKGNVRIQEVEALQEIEPQLSNEAAIETELVHLTTDTTIETMGSLLQQSFFPLPSFSTEKTNTTTQR